MATVRRVMRLILAGRYVMLAGLAAATYLHALAALGGWAGTDWYLFVLGADNLAGPSALHTFAALPDLQTGPLSLVVTIPLRHLGGNNGWYVTSALLFGVALLIIRLCETAGVRLGGESRDWLQVTVLVGGGLVLLAFYAPAGVFGHPDDPLALLAVAVAAWAWVDERWIVAAVAVGLAAAFKPWGLYLLPFAAAGDERRVRGLLVALAAGCLPWLPFLVADPHTLSLSHFRLGVAPASTLRVFGLAVGTKLSWIRGVQLVAACAAGGLALRSRRWMLVPLVALAVRVNLEVRTWSYYAAGVICAALIADVLRPTRVPALRTIFTYVLMQAVPHLAATLGRPGTLPVDVVDISARLLVLVAVLLEISPLGTRMASTPWLRMAPHEAVAASHGPLTPDGNVAKPALG